MPRYAVLGAIALVTLGSTVAAARPYPGLSGLAASADSAETAATNPAGITRFKQRATEVEIMWFSSESNWESQFGDSEVEFNSRDSGDTIVPRIFYLQPINDNFSASFTILGTGFSDDLGDWPGRYFIKSYESILVSAFPSLAYRINDQWSVAGSLALSYSSFEQERAVRNIFDPGFGDGKSKLESDGFEVGFGLSALYHSSPRTRWGLTYQSEIEPSQDGDSDFSRLGPNTEAVLLAWHLVTQERTDVRTFNSSTRYNCWNCRGMGMGTSSNVTVRQYTQGTFIVDMIDPSQLQAVWRSVFESRMRDHSDPARAAEARDAAVAAALADFPPKGSVRIQ